MDLLAPLIEHWPVSALVCFVILQVWRFRGAFERFLARFEFHERRTAQLEEVVTKAGIATWLEAPGGGDRLVVPLHNHHRKGD